MSAGFVSRRNCSPHTMRPYDSHIAPRERHLAWPLRGGPDDHDRVSAFKEEQRAVGLSPASRRRQALASRGICNGLMASRPLDDRTVAGRSRSPARLILAHDLQRLLASLEPPRTSTARSVCTRSGAARQLARESRPVARSHRPCSWRTAVDRACSDVPCDVAGAVAGALIADIASGGRRTSSPAWQRRNGAGPASLAGFSSRSNRCCLRCHPDRNRLVRRVQHPFRLGVRQEQAWSQPPQTVANPCSRSRMDKRSRDARDSRGTRDGGGGNRTPN